MSKEADELHLNSDPQTKSGEGLPISAPDGLSQYSIGKANNLEVRCSRPFDPRAIEQYYYVLGNFRSNDHPVFEGASAEIRPVGNFTTAYLAIVDKIEGEDLILRRIDEEESAGTLTWRFRRQDYNLGANALAFITDLRNIAPFALSTIDTEKQLLEQFKPFMKERTLKIGRDLKADVDTNEALDSLPLYQAFGNF